MPAARALLTLLLACPAAATQITAPQGAAPSWGTVLPGALAGYPGSRGVDLTLSQLGALDLASSGGQLLLGPLISSLEGMQAPGRAGQPLTAESFAALAADPAAAREVLRRAAAGAMELSDARAQHVLSDLKERRITAAEAEHEIDGLLIMQRPYLSRKSRASLEKAHGQLKTYLAGLRQRRVMRLAEEDRRKLAARDAEDDFPAWRESQQDEEDVEAEAGVAVADLHEDGFEDHPNVRKGLQPAQPADEEPAGNDPAIVGQEVYGRALARLRGRAGAGFIDAEVEKGLAAYLSQPNENEGRVTSRQLAVYDLIEDRIDFNRDPLQLGVFDAERLRTVPGLFERIAAILAPTLLHELKHRWTRQIFHDIASRENEFEAMHLQALYLLEEIDADRDYLSKLPRDIAETHIELLQAWLKGREDLASFVASQYGRLPSVYDDAKQKVAALRADLEAYRRRRDNYDQELAELKRRMLEAKEREEKMEVLEMRFGGFKISAELARQVATFPTRAAVERSIRNAQDQIAFWQSDLWLEMSRRHYTEAWEDALRDWTAWRDAHPGFELPLPPSGWQILKARIAEFFRWVGRLFGGGGSSSTPN